MGMRLRMAVVATVAMAMNAAGGEWVVAPDGNDGGAGTAAQPFRTIERAQAEARKAVAAGLKVPVTVTLRGGVYERDASLEFGPMDSGTAAFPVTYAAKPGETVRLLGGKRLAGFAPVRDPAILDRLDPAAREAVLQIDLRAAGVTNIGAFASRGFGRKVDKPAHLELFFGGEAMTVARWPNDDYAKIDGKGQPRRDLARGFHYREDEARPARWKSFDNVWMHGYWGWMWADSYEAIDKVNTETRHILMKPPYGNYFYRSGYRIRYLNVLEELDKPGEFYTDAASGILYFWPPRPVEGVEVVVSTLETPIITVSNASHLVFSGLTIEAGRDLGILIQDGERVTVTGCRILNTGTHGIWIREGSHHQVLACTITDCGDSGIEVEGGDRKTLRTSGHVIEDNEIYRVGRWCTTYRPGVQARGVGIRIAHNLIHDLPHSAIIYWGNEMVIEKNRIRRVCYATDDCGAIYTGRDYTGRGNIIRHNWITDVRGPGPISMGIYMDDCASGQTIEGNIIENAQVGMMLGGGRDLLVRNNVFLACSSAFFIDDRGARGMLFDKLKERFEAVAADKPPYSEAYPELREIRALYDKGVKGVPGKILLERNIAIGGTFASSKFATQITRKKDNIESGPHGFADPKTGDYRFEPDSPAARIGFEPIPTDQIGPRRAR